MHKENKILAKERRARERQIKERNEKLKKAGKWVLILLVIAGIIGLIWLGVKGLDSPDTGNDADSDFISTMEDTPMPELNTDSSLVVEDGDMVNIDYIGSVDGVEFSGGNTMEMGTDLTIGSGMYIEGFEEQVIGHKPGDTFDIKVTFPEGYRDSESVDGEPLTLAGKEAVFKTTLNGIYK